MGLYMVNSVFEVRKEMHIGDKLLWTTLLLLTVTENCPCLESIFKNHGQHPVSQSSVTEGTGHLQLCMRVVTYLGYSVIFFFFIQKCSYSKVWRKR